MSKYGKWLGGGLGWAFGGPLGAVLGFAIGTVIDEASHAPQTYNPPTGMPKARTRAGDFSASLLALSAAMMKSDGKAMKSELNFVKQFFTQQFGATQAREQMSLLKELLKQEIPVRDICMQIKFYMQYHGRLQLLHYLFGIAQADGNIAPSELQMLVAIANYMAINQSDFNSIKAMYYKATGKDYKILDIPENASEEEIKKAYRKMALKFHPDRVSHLGESVQKAAQEKFQAVQQAYENIKKQRGFS